MRLRWRFRVAIGGITIVILAAISWATYSIFSSAQARELDRELVARAQHEVGALVHSQGVVSGSTLRIGALDDHVKYAAIYDKAGALVARSETFESVPLRAALDRVGPFDLSFGDQHLRAVLWPFDDGELLLAASRRELDDDLKDLRRLLLELFGLGAVLSMFAAGWIGTRLSRSVEHVAKVAELIGGGDLGARVQPNSLDGSPEVVALGNQLNQMVDSLQSALAAQRRFVSNAAHELRSPLTVMLGEVELALRRERTVDGYKLALAELLDNVRELHALAEDLLNLAKVTPVGSESCDLAAVIEAALRASNTMAADHRGVRVSVEAMSVPVHGRQIDLARLFRNLIENALTHAPNNSTVRIATSLDPLQVSIEDDGAGVAEGMHLRIFEPFVRGGEERTGSGAGLGLAIARDIAISAGGELRLDHLRKPTRFVVRLVRAKSASA